MHDRQNHLESTDLCNHDDGVELLSQQLYVWMKHSHECCLELYSVYVQQLQIVQAYRARYSPSRK
jgi:hypothetical protein